MSENQSSPAMRRLILGTLVVPVGLFTAFFFLSRLYDPNEYPGRAESVESHFAVSAGDGTLLYGTVRAPTLASENSGADSVPGAAVGPVVFVADRGLDRDWNSNSLRIRSGAILARYLGSHGITTLRYDQRGTGQSRASRVNSGDLDYQAEDLAAVVRLARSLGPARNAPVLLAHGDGCGVALYALDRRLVHATRLVLLSCDLRGSLLENWGWRLLDRLRRAQVPPATLALATADWEAYIKVGTLPPVLEQKAERDLGRKNPDLAAFRAALRYLNGTEMRRFASVARHFMPARVVATAGIPVLHLIGEQDEEVVPSATGAEKSASARIVPAMDHFLKVSDEKKEGLRLVWARVSPFGKLHPAALHNIADFLRFAPAP